MGIKKFTESIDMTDLSKERIEEILTLVSELSSKLNDVKGTVDTLQKELENYKGESKENNDQIDDSSINLSLVVGYIGDSIDKLDVVSNSLTDYNNNGRQYLY